MSKKILVLFIWFLSLPGFLGAALLPISSWSISECPSELLQLPMGADTEEENTPRPNLLEEEVVEGLHHLSFLDSESYFVGAFTIYFSALTEPMPPDHTLCVDEQPPNP